MRFGRYEVFHELARGGMGSVHLARQTSELGVSRVVAVKRLRDIAADARLKHMFVDEARLCARIRHRNVVSLLDLVSDDDELYMALEYVEGETLARLVNAVRNQGGRIPDAIVAGLLAGALHGLHAAHEARAETGEPLGIVHRDFSPQNVLVGIDGVARVADFGVAKASVRLQTTRDGELKGKLGYMAPEQVSGLEVDRRTDVFAAGVVLWEALVQERLFFGESEAEILMKIVQGGYTTARDRFPGLHPGWDEILRRALARSPGDRFASAREMALAIETAFASATPFEIGTWVAANASESLARRASWVSEIERGLAPAPSVSAATAASIAAPRVAAKVDVAVDPASDDVRPGSPAAGATADGASTRRRSFTVRAGVGIVVVVAAAAATLVFWHGAATSSEKTAAAIEPTAPAPTVEASAPRTEVAPAPVASAEVPSPTTTSATTRPTTIPPRAATPPPGKGAPPSAGGCRYFDEKERIWKFKRTCFQ